MKSRMQKWAKYRRKIKETPEEKFKFRPHLAPTSKEEAELLLDKGSASSAVSLSSLPKKRITPYGVYLSRNRTILIVKIVFLAITMIGFLLLWFLWVNKV